MFSRVAIGVVGARIIKHAQSRLARLGTALSNASPALVQMHWPQRHTPAAARHYLAVAEAMVRIIAESATALTHYKAGGER